MPEHKRRSVSAVSFSGSDMGHVKEKFRAGKSAICQIVRPLCFAGKLETAVPLAAKRKADPSVPPAYLADHIALNEWHAIAPILARRGLLDEEMRPLLAGYCSALARTVRAEQILSREGRYYKTTTCKGSVMKRRHPAVQDAEEAWASVRHFARQLGISASFASSRSSNGSRSDFFK